MFSNGTEYASFLDNNCEKCAKFVDWELATTENPCCRIEERIVVAMIDKSAFPYEHLDENGSMSRYDCKEKVEE